MAPRSLPVKMQRVVECLSPDEAFQLQRAAHEFIMYVPRLVASQVVELSKTVSTDKRHGRCQVPRTASASGRAAGRRRRLSRTRLRVV